MTDSKPGALGRYEIQGILGKGAMGVVYKARDPLIGRILAIKTFRNAYLGDDEDAREFRARFLREAQSAGILNHPNIVTIHDVVDESEEGVTFIAMEYVEGTNLKELLREGKHLDLKRVSAIVSEVADALDYAHDKGVIHRDIKPANILLTRQGRVKLTDFGIARLEASDLTQDGQLLGTPNYMAPERILGRDVDRRTDVFSLGVVLYEMLTGRKPFRGDNLTMVTHQIVYEPFTPPRDYDLAVPREVIRVLERSMAKDPLDRFATAGEMAAELEVAVHLAESSGFVVAAPAALDEADEAGAATQDVSGQVPQPPSDDDDTEPGVPAGLSDSQPRAGAPLPASEAWAGEPPGGALSDDATVAAVIPEGEVAPRAAGSASEAVAPAAPQRKLSPAVLIGALAVLFLLGVGVLAVVLWPSGEERTAAEPEATSEPVSEAARYLAEARAALDRGEVGRADRMIRQGLVVDPDDPELLAMRGEVGQTLTEAELSAERESQIRAWLDEAREALEARKLDDAAAALERVRILEPDNEEVSALTEEIEEARSATERDRRRREAAREAARNEERAAEAAAAEAAKEQPAEPEPAQFTLSVVFLTEISQGTLTIYSEDEQIVREPFDFRKRTGLFKMEESAGQITFSKRLPRGEHNLRIYVAPEGRKPAVQTVHQTFHGGTEPTLKIVMLANGEMTAAIE